MKVKPLACLYCAVDRRNSPLSKEHIISAVLGGWLTYRCVCKSHNEQLGSDLEGKLKKNAFVAYALHSLGLQSLDQAYSHARVTIQTSGGKEFRGTIEGARPRLISQGTSNDGLVTPEETTKVVLRRLIAKFEAKHNVQLKWQDSDFDSLPYGELCHIPETAISFIKQKGGAGFVRLDGLNAPISFRFPAKIALTHLAALGCPFIQSQSFGPLKTWILHGGDNHFVLIGRRIDALEPSKLTYKPYHYIKYRFVPPHLLALVTLFSAIRFGVYLAELPEMAQWQHLPALDRYHVYDLSEKVVFASGCQEDHIALMDAVLSWRSR
jgi:hypothetical protein